MRELFDIFASAVLYGGIFGLAAISLGVFIVGAVVTLRLWRRAKHCAVLAVFAFAAIIVGGTKTGSVRVDDPYIVNAGSYITNDFIHVAVGKRYNYLPDSMDVLVFIREVAQTNAEDWVEVLPRHTFADSPFDIPLANATNYNAIIAANYVPEPTVHTNGVWQIKGFIVPGTTNATSTGVFAFPNTKTKLED